MSSSVSLQNVNSNEALSPHRRSTCLNRRRPIDHPSAENHPRCHSRRSQVPFGKTYKLKKGANGG
eukprot:8177370-Alexandrium_andersonii.AAC.1